MNIIKKLKLNENYFSLPPNKIKTHFKLKNYQFESIEIYDEKSNIYIFQKTSNIDEYLISKCMKVKYVMLNGETISKISSNTLKSNEIKMLLQEIDTLAANNISIVMPSSNYQTIFGEFTPINKFLALFLFKTQLDIKFLIFPGEYFAMPIWSDKPRINKIFSNNQLSIKHRMLIGLSDEEIAKTLLKTSPSTASTYSKKYPINLRGNNLACSLERLLYCCPSCNSFFTLYSEYSCIKCSCCGNAIEMSENGQILFSKKIKTFDDIDEFLYNALSKKDLKIEKLIEYKSIQNINEKCKKTLKKDIILQIYPEMIMFQNTYSNKTTKIYFEDMDDVELMPGNTVFIKLKNANDIIFYGKNNENFLILKHLFKLNTN